MSSYDLGLLAKGIPLSPMPAAAAELDPSVPHAPARPISLSDEEQKVAPPTHKNVKDTRAAYSVASAQERLEILSSSHTQGVIARVPRGAENQRTHLHVHNHIYTCHVKRRVSGAASIESPSRYRFRPREEIRARPLAGAWIVTNLELSTSLYPRISLSLSHSLTGCIYLYHPSPPA